MSDSGVNPDELKPVGFFVTMKYRCPHCQQSYFRTVEESRRAVRCACGAELRHRGVASIDVKVTFQNMTKTGSQS